MKHVSAEKTVKVSEFLDDKMIFLHTDFASSNDLFDYVGKKALQNDFVTDKFLPRIKDREGTFPTGLQLETRGVAIPHTDAETIKKEFVAIVVNDKPIDFKRMDDPETAVKVQIVFVLGLNQPHAQLEMLQALMEIIQDNKILDQLGAVTDKNEVKNLLK